MKNLIVTLLIFSVLENAFAQNDKFAYASILINEGNKYTNDFNVELKIFCKKSSQMQISHESTFQNTQWIPYKDRINWSLDTEEGKHTVYIRFKSGEDISKILSDDIDLDTKPPENVAIEIASNSGFVKSTDLTASLKIKGNDAKYMILSNQHSFYGKKWQSYEQTIANWQLEKGDDGYRYVYAKFKDRAQNESKIVSAKVLVDRQAPFGGHITINHGKKFMIQQDKIVELSIFAREADSMMISEDKDLATGEWEVYQTQKYTALKGGDGKKYLYVKFKDKAGNESGIVEASIILDITPPKKGKIIIDNEAKETTNLNKVVTLKIIAEGADWMLVSNNPFFDGARWIKFSPAVSDWKLSGEQDGKRTVFVKFKDAAGNVSSIFKDEIILKRGF